jgi:hypothetical protein
VQDEAYAMARAMHDTWLVSDYHATYLRWTLKADHATMLPDALGLYSTGLDALRWRHPVAQHCQPGRI